MDKSVRAVIEGLLEKAKQKLETARLLFEADRYDDAISRAYYAVFHAIQAVLETEGIRVDSHAALKTLFGLHFIKTGKFPLKFSGYLRNLKEDREEGDYEVFSALTEEDAEKALAEASEFLEVINAYLQPILS